MAFTIDPSNINSASLRLAMIGNNIANANTYGFKSSEFDNVLAATVLTSNIDQVACTQQNFSQGTKSASSNPLDMAISGPGFFQVKTPSDTLAYTRSGQFMLDKTGSIVNSTGDQLTGYTAVDGTILPGNVVPMSISSAPLLPKPSTTATLELTLDASANIPIKTPFSRNDPTSYTASTTTSVYDATGTPIPVQTFYVKTAKSTVDVYASVGDPSQQNSSGRLGTLTFGTNGRLSAPAVFAVPVPVPVAGFAPGVVVPGVAASGYVNFDMSSAVQYGTGFSATSTQDGSMPGEFLSCQVDGAGIITGNYSNGLTATLGQVALSSFKSEYGLAMNSNNQWLETTASGQASINAAGAGDLGTLQGSTNEDSNVDLTSEMIKMISAQRFFQVAAEMVKKQDEIMQTVVNIGQ